MPRKTKLRYWWDSDNDSETSGIMSESKYINAIKKVEITVESVEVFK